MSLFICPLCQSPLQPAVNSWCCDGSLNPKQTTHSFDVARQGYVNLLPVQQKKSKAPGDSALSIKARQRFLQAGYYQPLRDLICEQIILWLAKEMLVEDQVYNEQAVYANRRWLDIGCGEGYYTQALAEQVDIDELIAADISKPALIEMAKISKAANTLWYQQNVINTNQGINHEQTRQQSQKDSQQPPPKKTVVYPIVTSAAHLPLQAQSITGISSIFSPILPAAFAQVLQNDGYLIIAKPDVGHLASVRAALFDEVREHDSDKFLTELAPYFRLLDTQRVSTALSLSAGALADLLTMTPYAYRAQIDKRQTLLTTTETELFKTEAKFIVYVLQKLADK
ncbi:MAG: methyltransferase domain-containing protein [Psychrobacter sp.]|nr:methyltransferase domain-containing protein [Psychrobacter sp.]